MAEDFFALLGEPRRPWLDAERVKETFHALSRAAHPDQGANDDGAAFARLNAAQAALREPRTRLRHLIELEYPEVRLSGPASVPAGLADRFAAVHGLMGEIDAFAARKTAAPSALAKALLAREEFALRERVESLLEGLDKLHADAMAELQAFDVVWTAARPPETPARLHDLYQRFAYLSRWTEQLREHLFQLGM